MYSEGFKPLDGRRFLEAADRITRRGGAVILYRAGRTDAGRRATASHTASLAGDYTITRKLAEAAGVVVADTIEDFEDLVMLFHRLRDKRVDGWRLGAVSNAGFECVAVADHAGRFELAQLVRATRRRIEGIFERAGIDAVVDVHNPLDLTPTLGDDGFEAAVEAVMSDEGVDVGLVGCVPLTPALNTLAADERHGEDVARPDGIAPRLVKIFYHQPKALVAVVDGGPIHAPMMGLLEENGVPVFRTADRALALFDRYCGWRMRPPMAEVQSTGD